MNTSTPNTRRPTRAEKNAATTTALLDAAAQTFAEHGFEATTMDEIAERVGLSKGALYYRYKTKEDLFIALLDERCKTYVRQLEEVVGDSATPTGGWAAMAEQFLAVVRDESWPRLFFEFVSYASRSPRARRELVKRTRALRAALASVVERQASEAGLELPIPAAHVALAVSALGNGLALERLADPDAVPNEVFVQLPALIIAGIAARARRSAPTQSI